MNAANDIVGCLHGNCTAAASKKEGVVKACGKTFLDEDEGLGLSSLPVPGVAGGGNAKVTLGASS